jgi:hypothetical protein
VGGGGGRERGRGGGGEVRKKEMGETNHGTLDIEVSGSNFYGMIN